MPDGNISSIFSKIEHATKIADKNGLSNFEISEYIAYIALCFRNKIVIRNKLLGLAMEVIDKKEYFLRRKQFKSLMEEK